LRIWAPFRHFIALSIGAEIGRVKRLGVPACNLLALQGPAVSEEEAQQNWERLKRDLEAEDDEQVDQWSTAPTTQRR
jgi:hypothetical protein